MEPIFSTWGAVVGLAAAVILIVRKTPPAYALVFGALAGGLVGGGGLEPTVNAMIEGAKGMMPSVLRILASGVLAGALLQTGAAAKIADTIVGRLGVRFALPAVAIASAIICAVGVFADIAVITVAPIALAVGRKAGIPVPALLIAMIGGVKAGNVVSPNPNTIAAADAFQVDLTALMARNAIPALCALAATVAIALPLARRGRGAGPAEGAVGGPDDNGRNGMPGIVAAVLGPIVVVGLLALGYADQPLPHTKPRKPDYYRIVR